MPSSSLTVKLEPPVVVNVDTAVVSVTAGDDDPNPTARSPPEILNVFALIVPVVVPADNVTLVEPVRFELSTMLPPLVALVFKLSVGTDMSVPVVVEILPAAVWAALTVRAFTACPLS